MPNDPRCITESELEQVRRDAYRDGRESAIVECKARATENFERGRSLGQRQGYVDGVNAERATAKLQTERVVFLSMLAGFMAAMIVTWFVIGVTGGI